MYNENEDLHFESARSQKFKRIAFLVISIVVLIGASKLACGQDIKHGYVDSMWRDKKWYGDVWHVRITDGTYNYTTKYKPHCWRCNPDVPKRWIIVNDGNKSFLKPEL